MDSRTRSSSVNLVIKQLNSFNRPVGNYAQRLNAIEYPINEIPESYCSQISLDIMENPVYLWPAKVLRENQKEEETEEVVYWIDESEYLRLYEEKNSAGEYINRDKKDNFINPFTRTAVITVYKNEELKMEIETFVRSMEEVYSIQQADKKLLEELDQQKKKEQEDSLATIKEMLTKEDGKSEEEAEKIIIDMQKGIINQIGFFKQPEKPENDGLLQSIFKKFF